MKKIQMFSPSLQGWIYGAPPNGSKLGAPGNYAPPDTYMLRLYWPPTW
jgi:hypothetical protein